MAKKFSIKSLTIAHILVISITLANSACGFIAAFFLVKYVLLRDVPGSFSERYLTGMCLFFVLAVIFDTLDGKLSRFFGVMSSFGRELDSLCDAITYGAIGALVIAALNSFNVNPYWGTFSWLCAIIYLSGVLLRLARFNLETSVEEKYHLKFKGIPSPGACGMIVGIIMLYLGLRDGNILFTKLIWGLFSGNSAIQFSNYLIFSLPFIGLLLAFLMVSEIEYFHIGAALNSFVGKKPFEYLIDILIAFLLIVIFREMTFTLFALFYFSYGPSLYFYNLLTRKSAKP